MNRVFSWFALLLLILFGAIIVVAWQPGLAPGPLAPIASWLNNTLDQALGERSSSVRPSKRPSLAETSPATGMPMARVPAGSEANIGLGESNRADALGRNRVARVAVDESGRVRIEAADDVPPDPAAAGILEPGAVINEPVAGLPSRVVEPLATDQGAERPTQTADSGDTRVTEPASGPSLAANAPAAGSEQSPGPVTAGADAHREAGMAALAALAAGRLDGSAPPASPPALTEGGQSSVSPPSGAASVASTGQPPRGADAPAAAEGTALADSGTRVSEDAAVGLAQRAFSTLERAASLALSAAREVLAGPDAPAPVPPLASGEARSDAPADAGGEPRAGPASIASRAAQTDPPTAAERAGPDPNPALAATTAGSVVEQARAPIAAITLPDRASRSEGAADVPGQSIGASMASAAAPGAPATTLAQPADRGASGDTGLAMAAATDPAARAAANGSGRQKTLPGEQGGLAAEVRRLARTESEQMALARRETNRLIAAATNVAGDPPRRVLGMIETNPPGDPAPVVAGAGAKPGPTPGPSSPSPAGAPALALAPTPLASPISAENRARLGSVLPPDAPLPAAASTPEAKAQEATILNFLEGKVVEFQVGRDQLTANGRAALNDLSKIIRKNRDTLIIVQGHTDSVGDKASNLELSGARALVARDYLVSLGVDPARLSVQGFGESKPIATNRTDEGRRRNRRIDFAVRERR